MSTREIFAELEDVVVLTLLCEDEDQAVRLWRRADGLMMALHLRGELPRRSEGCQCMECWREFYPEMESPAGTLT